MQYLLRGHHIIIHALTNLQSGKRKKKRKKYIVSQGGSYRLPTALFRHLQHLIN